MSLLRSAGLLHLLLSASLFSPLLLLSALQLAALLLLARELRSLGRLLTSAIQHSVNYSTHMRNPRTSADRLSPAVSLADSTRWAAVAVAGPDAADTADAEAVVYDVAGEASVGVVEEEPACVAGDEPDDAVGEEPDDVAEDEAEAGVVAVEPGAVFGLRRQEPLPR